jgi:hypothetical protein
MIGQLKESSEAVENLNNIMNQLTKSNASIHAEHTFTVKAHRT